MPGEAAQYRLKVNNYQDEEVRSLIVYETLPRVGDTVIVADRDGYRAPRGSEYDVYLTGPVEVPAGYTAYYWVDPLIQDPSEAVQASGWTTTVSNYDAVTAIKVVMEDGGSLAPHSSVQFVLPVESDGDAAAGQQSFNSFAVSINGGISFLEALSTSIEMMHEVAGTKTWGDDGPQSRPASITVLLNKREVAADGTVKTTLVRSQDVEPDADGNWTYSFSRLPYYVAGKKTPINYVIDEAPVVGYRKTILGNDIMKVRTGTCQVTLQKYWLDDSETTRPADVTVQLYRRLKAEPTSDGVYYRTITLEPSAWTTTLNLSRYDGEGREFEYYVHELINGPYVVSDKGYIVTTGADGMVTVDQCACGTFSGKES